MTKHYSALALVLSISLAGCQSGISSRFSSDPLSRTDSYMLVTPARGGQCFTRIIDGFPHDQVCQRRDFLRYTTEPVVPRYAIEIPPHVVVLFNAHGDRHRFALSNSSQEGSTASQEPFASKWRPFSQKLEEFKSRARTISSSRVTFTTEPFTR